MINGLPDKLKQQRLLQGLSQRTVAKKLNVSPSIISGYETGERTPSAEVLLSLSYLYRCSTDYLLGKEKPVMEYALSLDGLTEQQIRLITELVDTMRE